MSNIQTVQVIYAAFGQGDIPTILGHLGENIEWEYGTVDPGVPWLQPRRGLAEVPRFFESLGSLDFQRFQPKTFLERGNIVVVLVDLAAVVKANGRSIIEEDEVHIWHFDDRGRVIRFCHRVDTHKHWLAIQKE